jgi:hypothetical protein
MKSAWLASVTDGSATVPSVRFCVGDTVDVLNASRLPKVEEVRHTGVIERILEIESGTLYVIAGLPMARSAAVLRLVRRAR